MQSDWLLRFRDLATSLTGRASREKEAEVGVDFDRRVQNSLELIDHGEPGVALENLAQNVYEFDLPLSRDEYAVFDQAGIEMGLDRTSWSFLEALVS